MSIPKFALACLMSFALWCVLLLIVFSCEAHAAAFNCAFAKLPTEVLICQTPELSAADELNAEMFYKIRGAMSTRSAAAFSSLERQWIQQRNDCGYDKQCIVNSYLEHFGYLCGASEDVGLGFSDCEE